MYFGPLYEPDFYVCFVLRVASGPRMKLAGRESALTTLSRPHPPRRVVYSTDYSKVVVPVVIVLFVVCSLFNEASCFKFCLVLLYSYIFQSFQHCDYFVWGKEN